VHDLPGVVMLAVLAAALGIYSGLIGALFHFTVDRADHLRMVVVILAHDLLWPGLALLVDGPAAAAALAASLIRRVVPSATGSGIPRVQAILDGEFSRLIRRLIPVKFAGGVLAIGCGRRQKRNPARYPVLLSGLLEALDRIPRPQPDRGEDALPQGIR
jgi:CIC family chloride channel protein